MNNNLRAYVRYDSDGKIVASSLILTKSKPKKGDWEEIDVHNNVTEILDRKKYLRAFVKCDSKWNVIPGSLIVTRIAPKLGNWVEIRAYKECLMCLTTTTSTTTIVASACVDCEPYFSR